MTKPPKKSGHKKQLEKMEAKLAKEAADKQAAEAKKAAQDAEMKQWLELAAAAMLEEQKRRNPKMILPPSPYRLRAMARHLFKCVHGTDGVVGQDIFPLMQVINRLSPQDRETFNKYYAEREKEING